MDIGEVTDWVMGIEVAGEPLKLSNPSVASHHFKYDLEPTQEQLLVLKPGEPLLLKEGEPTIELMIEDGKHRLIVTPDQNRRNP